MTSSPERAQPAKFRFGALMSQTVESMSAEATIHAVLERMVSLDISCMLIHNATHHIVGIVTERDVLRRYALLDVPGKQVRSISTLMSRPVRFARLSTLRADLAQLHAEAKLRHFPVIDGESPTTTNVVGMVTMTDLGRQYLGEMAVLTGGGAHDPVQLLGTASPEAELTARTLTGLGFAVNRALDELTRPEPAIVDFDGLALTTVKQLLIDSLRHPTSVVFTGSARPDLPEVAAVLRHGHTWLEKPIDLMLVDWLLRRRQPVRR
jgi:CBS domain-containing protein